MTEASPARDVEALVQQMRQDWNARAHEDARFYIACGRRNQDDIEFSHHAEEVIARIRRDFAWLPSEQPKAGLRFLEIGCGIGRLMSHLAADCGEIHGVDISEEMVRQGRLRMAHIANAQIHHAAQSDLRSFADDSFDVVYSYAVLQHLPDVSLVWRYFDEAARVLRSGGVLTFQVNALPIMRESYDTWSGAVTPAQEAAGRCRANGLRIRTLEGVDTQYAWITAQKSPSPEIKPRQLATITKVEASDGSNDLLAARDAVRLLVRRLPTEVCDVTELTLRADDLVLTTSRIGVADAQRERVLEALVPSVVTLGAAADLVLLWRGTPVSAPAKVMLGGSLGPGACVLRVTDGQELSRENVSSCGWLKLWLRDWSGSAEDLAAHLGPVALPFHLYCDDARLGLWQVNLQLPPDTLLGPAELFVQLGRGKITSFSILIEATAQ